MQIDAWRFDVIHMLGEGAGAKNNAHYVREFRREENPEAYLLGEHFHEATSWLQGDQEDGAMNYYGFTYPLRQFLSRRESSGRKTDEAILKTDAQDLDFLWQRARTRIPSIFN
ncbi:MAG: alpha-amylase family glycosyl hydrolase [Actinomycetota bacterium]